MRLYGIAPMKALKGGKPVAATSWAFPPLQFSECGSYQRHTAALWLLAAVKCNLFFLHSVSEAKCTNTRKDIFACSSWYSYRRLLHRNERHYFYGRCRSNAKSKFLLCVGYTWILQHLNKTWVVIAGKLGTSTDAWKCWACTGASQWQCSLCKNT